MIRPRLAMTMGDPAGIGPELCLKALHDPDLQALCDFVLVGELRVCEAAAALTGQPLPRVINATELGGKPLPSGTCLLALEQWAAAPPYAQATAEAGRICHASILKAIALAQGGEVDGVVTAPITKAALQLAGVHEPGHTEIFAHQTGTSDYGMLLYSERLAVALVTIHQSLASVPAALTMAEIVRMGRLAARTLARLRGRAPRIAVLGLNPHAGEGGLFGDEEARLIAPAVAALRAAGIDAEGPISPDAAFQPQLVSRYDVHLCMYHDQGLIPFKMVSVHDGVNMTMGLPIIRTSPDHGTAYAIAGKNEASPSSMAAAVRLAVQLALARDVTPA